MLGKVPTLLGMNHCWVVLTFWYLELVGKGSICIPLNNGFQKERIGCAHLLEVPKNHITGFHPWLGFLRNSKTHVTEPTLIHQFFHHFENHHFLKNFKNPKIEILLILKLFKNQNWRFWGSGNFQKVELVFLWFVKLKKTQDLRFSTKSKNHPSWWELHVRNWKNQTWTRSDFQNWNQIFINTIRPRRWGYSVAKSDPAPV